MAALHLPSKKAISKIVHCNKAILNKYLFGVNVKFNNNIKVLLHCNVKKWGHLPEKSRPYCAMA
jgi:hypothetical protein